MKWKTYLRRTAWFSLMLFNGYVGLNSVKMWAETKTSPDVSYTIPPQDSLRQMLANLTPEKRESLRQLYDQVYPGQRVLLNKKRSVSESGFQESGSVSHESGRGREIGARGDVPEKMFIIDTILHYSANRRVILHNIPAPIYDSDSNGNNYFHHGRSMTFVPYIEVVRFYYNGNSQRMRTGEQTLNNMRQMTLIHECRHQSHRDFILKTPKKSRLRSIHATDELFAMIGGELSPYAKLGPSFEKWDQVYEAVLSLDEIEFIIPEKEIKTVIDSAIINALTDSQDVFYRMDYIEKEGREYLECQEKTPKENTMATAIKKMRSEFKINGKKVDILSLASDKVRRRAEAFINDRDDDMRLVMFAHDEGIEL